MDMSDYTPGPWKYTADDTRRGSSDGLQDFHLFGADGTEIIGGCGCCGSPYMASANTETDEANARLIAAAPDLLIALQTVRSNLIRIGWEENSIMIEGIDAAITKAGAK